MPTERKQLNVRMDDNAWDLFDQLCEKTGLRQTDVIMQGIRLLARREGLKVRKQKKPADSVDES